MGCRGTFVQLTLFCITTKYDNLCNKHKRGTLIENPNPFNSFIYQLAIHARATLQMEGIFQSISSDNSR